MQPDLTRLNARYEGDAEGALRVALSGALGKIAMVSSFGADSAVLLHLVAQIDRATPVLFINTLMLFPETLTYQHDLGKQLGLTDLRVIGPDRAELLEKDADNILHLADTDSCCDLRKTRPLERALQGFDGWITGRKRYQGGLRASLDQFEHDPATGHLKVNPLAGWSAKDLGDYMNRHMLPRHPLVARGYPSIGCAPCTGPVAAGEDPRAGRWRGQEKDECGIHIVDGRVIRRQAS
ncbi:phosphoadenylyl-sulfate reductase [Pararhodobacter zhoushanensis]|uniref:phosphoadenylyl-sulfate reductase n=1 Tax=Pararhodobacter zhoushanensis TaxID=2479545 RepID=UPI001FE88BCC|nr:phosphoadenylyl-sulfate reductase [Pararhodobacter zhoushanensis]